LLLGKVSAKASSATATGNRALAQYCWKCLSPKYVVGNLDYIAIKYVSSTNLGHLVRAAYSTFTRYHTHDTMDQDCQLFR